MRRPGEVALEYAARGWSVFPCHSVHDAACSCRQPDCGSPGKHPRVGTGLKAATTDAETIGRWWRRWPSANVAVRTGAASGLVVLDVDPAHGGARSLDALVRRHGPLPAGPVVRTGSGGLHFFFAHPGHAVRNSAGLLGPGLDVRGDGGYVIAPPSRHRSGREYLWQAPPGVLPELPDWFAEAPRPVERPRPDEREPVRIDTAISAWARAALDDEAHRVRGAPEGTRNATLNRAAFCLGQIVGAGMLDAVAVEGVLVASGAAAGLGERESTLTVRSGLRAGMAHPRAPSRATGPAAASDPIPADLSLDAADLP